MSDEKKPIAVVAAHSPLRKTKSSYPEPFFSRMGKREKRVLGDQFGLKNFGVNLTTLAPGGESALMHRHSKQDEFIYVIEGSLTLDISGKGKVTLKKGETHHIPRGVVHQAINPSATTPFKVVTFGVFEKGQPDTTVVAE